MNIATGQSITLFGNFSISRERLILLSLAFCGFSSVGSISLTVFELGSLRLFFSFWVIPSILFISLSALAWPQLGKRILIGWLAGILAVLLYDVSRIPFMLAGWDDFIPKIGVWLVGKENVSPWLGYLYRYAGNGGGMGISLVLIAYLFRWNNHIVRRSVIYGVSIFSCLMLTLVFSPLGQEEMFRITPLTFSGSLLGHIIYGLVLGLALRRWKAWQ